jgi:hypothetical protein
LERAAAAAQRVDLGNGIAALGGEILRQRRINVPVIASQRIARMRAR